MHKDDREKLLESNLPSLPTSEHEKKAVEYVSLVYGGMTKQNAFKTVHAERYERVYNKAKNNNKKPEWAVQWEISSYERGKYVSKLYKITQESYWVNFIDKRTRLLDKMYDHGMDDSLDFKDQISAAKVFLSHIPEIQKEEKVVHEHKLAEDTKFIAQLMEKKRLLYQAANEDEIIDVEMEDLNGV